MSLEMIQIGSGSQEWHEAFLGFVPRIFPGVDFRLWHARCGWPDSFVAHVLVDGGEIVTSVASSSMVLTVYDVIAQHPFDLGAVLPRLIEREIVQVEFGFTPERWWPTAVAERPHSELFVRGLELPTEPFKFPVLAHT